MDAQELLAKAKRRIVPVDDEVLGRVFVRSLSVAEARQMHSQLRDGETPEDAEENSALQVSLFLCDENGVPVLTKEQAREMCAGNFLAVQRVVIEGNRLNTPTKANVETARGN